MKDEFYEKTIKTTTVFKGRVINLIIEDVELPDGSVGEREIVHHPGAVAIIALTKKNKLLLVKQFRKPLEKTIVELPAGKLEPDEEPLHCAIRELEEETGFRGKNVKFVTAFYTSPGFADEFIHIFFTDQIEAGEVNRDADEFLSVMEVSLEEAEQLMAEQLICDAKTIFAIQFLKLKGGFE